MASIPGQYRAPVRQPEASRPPARPAGSTPGFPKETPARADNLGMPFRVFCIYMFILMGRPQDYIPALAPLRLGLLFTGLTALFTIFRDKESGPSPFRHRETKLYFFFFLVMVVTIPFSVYRRGSFEFVVLAYSANVAFFFLFLAHVDTMEKFRKVLFILVLSSLTFTLAGLAKGRFQDGRYYTGSDMFDPNDTAFMEVSFLCFGLCVLLGMHKKSHKVLALVSVIASFVLALFTGSRGGLLGLATIVLAFLALQVPTIRKHHKVSLVVLGAVILAASFSKLNVDRYLTLGDLNNDYNASDEFGRTQIWVRGFRLFLEDPLTGVGVRQFGKAIGDMRMHEGSVIPEWQAPHNSYVETLTETGLFGIAAFLGLIVTCLTTFNFYRRRPELLQPGGSEPMAGVLLIGFMAELVGAMFLTQTYSMTFLLFFVMSAALKQIAERVSTQSLAANRGKANRGK
jgi:O-antigen ligase